MFSVLILPAARQEIIDAHDWYERELTGLGVRFREELDHQIERITSKPLHFPVALADVRRASFLTAYSSGRLTKQSILSPVSIPAVIQ